MSTNGKPKFSMYWAASCGGCEISVLNIHEKILEVDANFEVVFWPVVMDSKYKDLEAMEDNSILLTLFNGGIRNDENEEIARLLRKKTQIMVAFGSCATEGGIPGLGNLGTMKSIFDTAYFGVSTENPEQIYPKTSFESQFGQLHLPKMYPVLRTLDQVVPVDYFMPGCPPEPHQIGAVIDLVIQVLNGKAELPPKGSVIGAGTSTVCDECKRTRTEKKIKKFMRIQDVERIDPEICLFDQGIPCNGPATSSGCDARCPAVGAQCIGCYGPAGGVIDYGARLMSAFASVIDSNDPDEIESILESIPDPAGQFYRFNLAKSLLRSSKYAWKGE
ncbi:MAG: oxidoreductase [Anaerolinea sp.]|nr:oxidoreductase [Anaerolinea sp.]